MSTEARVPCTTKPPGYTADSQPIVSTRSTDDGLSSLGQSDSQPSTLTIRPLSATCKRCQPCIIRHENRMKDAHSTSNRHPAAPPLCCTGSQVSTIFRLFLRFSNKASTLAVFRVEYSDRLSEYSHYSVISVPVLSTVDITGTTEAPPSPRDRGM